MKTLLHEPNSFLSPGPQREFFPGGTKIDAGHPNSSEAVTAKSKKVLLEFGLIFCPKLGEEQKKVFTQIWSHFLLKIRAWKKKNLVQKTCRDNLKRSGPPKPGPPWTQARVRCTP